jgi:hypothetical protein
LRERIFGPYRIERPLATGGMAEVFVAHRQGPHGWTRRVALKCMLPQLARDPEFTAMFVDEARLAARLEHPAIVPVFDFGEHEGTLFLAMEYVEGASLARLSRALVLRGEALPLSAVLHVGIEIARALAYAHHARDARGRRLEVVHRDISPGNLLVARRGQPKVADFGIARFAEAVHRTDEGLVRGKLGYLSPEQVTAGEIDGRTDVFALATVLAELLLGEPLFGGGTELDVLLRIRNADLGVLQRSRRRLPSDLVAALERALARQPGARPDAAGFAEALEQLARRRDLLGQGALELSRALFRLDLVAPSPEDADAREPGARPTALVETDAPLDVTPDTARVMPRGVEERLAEIALEPGPLWEVERTDGHVVGPLTFSALARRILAGEVPDGAAVRPAEAPRAGGLAGPGELMRPSDRPIPLEGTSQHGPLAGGALLSVACQLGKERRTGLLSLASADGTRRKRIYFVDGRPDFVSSNDPGEVLGEHLVRSGTCVRMEIEMALAMAPKLGGRLGDALVRLGILTPHALYSALAAQVRTRYLEAFRWREGSWCFVPDQRAAEASVPLREGVPDLLRAAAESADLAVVTGALWPLHDRTLLPGRSPPFPLSVYGARPLWTEVVGSAVAQAASRTVAQHVSEHAGRSANDSEEVLRALWFGLSTDLLRAA